jgi:hypothetical protein
MTNPEDDDDRQIRDAIRAAHEMGTPTEEVLRRAVAMFGKSLEIVREGGVVGAADSPEGLDLVFDLFDGPGPEFVPIRGGDEWAAGIFRRRPRPDPEIEAGPDGPTATYARSITPEVRAALRDALPKLFNLIPVVGPMLALIVRLVVEASAARRAKADPLEHAAMTADRSTYHPAMTAALDGRLPIGPEEDDDRPRKETPQ